MIPPKHILLPVDFSERSMDAAREAAVLAGYLHAGVTVLHVVDPRQNEFAHFEPGGVKVGELEKFLTDGFAGTPVSRIMREGDPADEIVSFAAANRVDAIVMASHGYTPFESFVLGSVAAEVLREARCPVWISVQAVRESQVRFRNLLCAVDLGPRTEAVVHRASQLAAAFNARLSLIHVFRSFDMDQMPERPEQWLSHEECEELDRVRRTLGGLCQILFSGGDISEAVCRHARKLRADLVAIGRSPKWGDFETTHGTGYTIIRKSPCPVVSV